ncbi:MAG: hypothetical protein ACRCY1_05390 [Leuconostoc suionicum]
MKTIKTSIKIWEFWFFITSVILVFATGIIYAFFMNNRFQHMITIGQYHLNILKSLFPILTVFMMIISEFLWLNKKDIIKDPNQVLSPSQLKWMLFSISVLCVLIIFFTTPWKWVNPILTVVNTIWIPLLWKNNKTNRQNTDNNVNSTDDVLINSRTFTIKSRKYKKPLRYK